MEYVDQPNLMQKLAPLLGALAAGALIVALVLSYFAYGALMTAGFVIVAAGATLLAVTWRRRALDAAHRAARRLAAYRLPPTRKPGEHRTSHRTAQLVPATWRMPTPPAGVPTYHDLAARRSVLALP